MPQICLEGWDNLGIRVRGGREYLGLLKWKKLCRDSILDPKTPPFRMFGMAARISVLVGDITQQKVDAGSMRRTGS